MPLMTKIMSSPLAPVFITICAYIFAVWLFKKTKWSFLHPLAVAIPIIIIFISIFHIDYAVYAKGGDIILSFMGPLTVSLAVPLYKNVKKLKENVLPILASTTIGSVVSVLSVILVGKMFKLDSQTIISLLPRSVTLPIGLPISTQMQGIVYITLISIMVTATFGAILAPAFFKWFKSNDDAASGLALGTSAHAVGISRAMEVNELMGSMASLAMVSTAVVTIFIAQFAVSFI